MVEYYLSTAAVPKTEIVAKIHFNDNQIKNGGNKVLLAAIFDLTAGQIQSLSAETNEYEVKTQISTNPNYKRMVVIYKKSMKYIHTIQEG